MFKKILLPVENSEYDAAIVTYVRNLAKSCGASVVVIHVADGFAARNVKHLGLRESEEIREDRDYVEQVARTLSDSGVTTDSIMAGGDPAQEICQAAEREGCDLITMATHGHRFFKDLLFGSVATELRHMCRVPVLLVLGKPVDDASRDHVT